MSGRNAPDDGGHPVVLFDGVCNLCESTVRFIIARDRRSQFRFASLQSDVARELAAPFDDAHDELSSVLLIEDGRIYSKARAGLRIARRLDGAWPLFYYLFFWVPGFVANPYTAQCLAPVSTPIIAGVPCVASNIGLCSSFVQNKVPPRTPRPVG